MDGRDSSGRKVNLLSAPPSVASAYVPAQLHSSSPPPLSRSDSTASGSRNSSSSSPVTPQFTSFASHHLYNQRYPYAKMDENNTSIYPPIDNVNANMMPYQIPAANATQHQMHTLPPMQQQSSQIQLRASQSPDSESRVSNNSNGSKQQAQQSATPKKNQYPCPMAKQYNCSDFFTTSGHAARHAKKHTGKKDAYCPECNKAFTRKDNMEQHRRTHQSVRGPSKNSGENRVKKSSNKYSRKSDRMSSAPLEAAVSQLEEEQRQAQAQSLPQAHPLTTSAPMPQSIMPGGPGPYFVNPEPVQSLPQPMPIDFSGRPQLYRNSYTNSLDFIPQSTTLGSDPHDLPFTYPSPGLSNGLNTLALAASDHRRMSEEEASNHSS